MLQRDLLPTADEEIVGTINAVFVIPDNDRVLSILSSLVHLATDPEHWRQDGTGSPEYMALVFTDIWLSLDIE